MAVVRAIDVTRQSDYQAAILSVLRPRVMGREPLRIGAGEVFSGFFCPTSLGSLVITLYICHFWIPTLKHWPIVLLFFVNRYIIIMMNNNVIRGPLLTSGKFLRECKTVFEWHHILIFSRKRFFTKISFTCFWQPLFCSEHKDKHYFSIMVCYFGNIFEFRSHIS